VKQVCRPYYEEKDAQKETEEMKVLLSKNPDTRRAFEALAKKRRLDFEDLSKALGAEMSDEVLRASLGELKAEGLIEEREAPIADYSIYYLTEEGLATADRLFKLNHIEELLS
jgi:DNA-binding HxlR family transcriptional regulator